MIGQNYCRQQNSRTTTYSSKRSNAAHFTQTTDITPVSQLTLERWILRFQRQQQRLWRKNSRRSTKILQKLLRLFKIIKPSITMINTSRSSLRKAIEFGYDQLI